MWNVNKDTKNKQGFLPGSIKTVSKSKSTKNDILLHNLSIAVIT